MAQRTVVNGVELAWDEWGAGPGPTLVLCHGYTGSALDFSLQVEALAAGPGDRRVVTLDQRGHGRSTKCGDLASYSIEILVADLIAFIEAVGPGPVDLLGHSMGGRVALGVVLARPDLIRSLVLMDTSAWSFIPPDESIAQLMAKYMEAFDPSRGVPSSFGLVGPEDALIEAVAPASLRKSREESLAGMDAYAIKALGTELLAEGVASLRPRLGEITCPTTVIVGQKDHPLVEQAPALAAEVAHGQVSVIDGAYHSPQLTHPDQWRAAVERHLALT
jgi:2-succinyl-6-hydroxy-2,4-cyclohexadiene-1-carboxylate synthase